MNDIKKKLTDLLDKERWNDEDRLWMSRYLQQDNLDILQSVAEEYYHEDLEKVQQILSARASEKILTKIYDGIRRKNKKYKRYQFLTAAAAAILLFLSAGLYQLYTRDANQGYIEKYTKAGERLQLELPDGTRVWLSPGSRFIYPKAFNGPERTVQLSGEAFFEVSHQADHPFIIHSGSLKTEVLGTSFDVNAYPDRRYAIVTVASGEVSVKNSGRHSRGPAVKLLQDERVVYNRKNNRLSKEAFPDAAGILYERRNGILRYHGADLQAVVEDLSIQYGIRIRLGDSLRRDTYYGSFNVKQNSVSASLQLLCLALHATLEKENGFYMIGR